MAYRCTQCGNEYEVVARHWSCSDYCNYPQFTNEQKEVIVGLLMGDGTIERSSKTPKLAVSMISPNYLQYIDEIFGVLGKGVKLKCSADKKAKNDRDSGFNPNAKSENYHNLYRWRSMSHPGLERFADWYSSGNKVWPEDIELTPTVLKHWYCGDGSWNNGGSNNHIQISMANEVDNTEKVDKMFESVGLPAPNNYCVTSKDCGAQFTVSQSKELWEYMGEPLPDFEYKWPEEYRQP